MDHSPIGSEKLMEEIGEPIESATDDSFNRGFEKGVLWERRRSHRIEHDYAHEYTSLYDHSQSSLRHANTAVLVLSVGLAVTLILAQLEMTAAGAIALVITTAAGLFLGTNAVVNAVFQIADYVRDRKQKKKAEVVAKILGATLASKSEDMKNKKENANGDS